LALRPSAHTPSGPPTVASMVTTSQQSCGEYIIMRASLSELHNIG
jgi:hypothetical protein